MYQNYKRSGFAFIKFTLTISFIFLFLQLLGLLLNFTLFDPEKPLRFTEKIIETNDFNLNMYENGIFSQTESVLVAMEKNILYIGSRETGKIFVSKIKNNKINVIEQIQIESDARKRKVFIYDMEIIDHNIYLSAQDHDGLNCENFRIIRIDTNTKEMTQKTIWNHNFPCIVLKGEQVDTGFSGRLVFDGKYLYLSGGMIITDDSSNIYPNVSITGTHSNLDEELKRNTIYGAVTRIDPETGVSRVFTNGHRVPQGLAVLKEKNKIVILETEHGPRGGDELNLLVSGKNYGWPYETYGQPYDTSFPNLPGAIHAIYGKHQKYTPPVYFWTPSIGVSQIAILEKNISKSSWLKNDLLVASLKNESIHHLKFSLNPNSIKLDERIYLGRRIRDIITDGNTIICGTDSGSVIILKPNTSRSTGQFPQAFSHLTFLYKITHIFELLNLKQWI